MKREKLIKTASESTKTSEVQAQPINRTELKVMVIDQALGFIMNKKPELHEFSVFITAKKLESVYNKKSPFYGNKYWRLWVETENNSKVKEILVYREFLKDPTIWEHIDNNYWLDKRYWTLCDRKLGAGRVYRLINWKELNNHGSN